MPVKRNGNGELIVRPWALTAISIAVMILGFLFGMFGKSFMSGVEAGALKTRVAVNASAIEDLRQTIKEQNERLLKTIEDHNRRFADALNEQSKQLSELNESVAELRALIGRGGR